MTSPLSFLAGVASATALLVGLHSLIGENPAPPLPKCTSVAEVTDLIARLKPLVKDRYSWREGISVTFYGDKRVEVAVDLDSNNKYQGTAATLKEAVLRITSPSSEIKHALEGWTAP